MKIIHGYGAISKRHKRRKSEDFLPQLLYMMIPCQLCNRRVWYHCSFCTCTCYVGEIMIPCQLSTFSEFIWNALMSYGSALIIPLIPVRSLSTMFSPRTLSRGQPRGPLVKLITNLWFTQISKNSNFNYSNFKTNGTNRKFIIFLKLMALTESL